MNREQSCKGWEKFAAGDSTYFKEVFIEYYPNLYRYGVKLCNRPQFVKDNIQELFEKIWKMRNNLEHIESPYYYLSATMRRQIFKKLAREKDRKHKFENHQENQPSIVFGIEEAIIRGESVKEQKEELIKALNQLPVKQREVIYLKFYQGMSYGEIAKILSINRQSVRNHVYRAMEIMRTLLREEVMRIIHFSQSA